MADNVFIGAAIAIRDIWKLVVIGTYAEGDTLTLNIGYRSLEIVLGADANLDDVVTAITNAWNAGQRRDGVSAPYDTSNAGGQEFGEFSEYTATTDGVDTVWFTGNTPGKPGEILFNTDGAGTYTLDNVQVATGPNSYTNTANWSLTTVPDRNDTLVLKDSNVDLLYDFPDDTELPAIRHHMSYTGRLGLRTINIDDPNKPYQEYRRQYPYFSDSGYSPGEGDFTHQFGIGEGEGSPFMRLAIYHDTDGHSNITVFNTGKPDTLNAKALEIVLSNTFETGAEVNVFKGSVHLKDTTNNTLEFTTLNIAANLECDVLIENITVSDFAVVQAGGDLVLRQKLATVATNFDLDIRGGTCVIDDIVSSGTIDIVADDGKIIWNTADSFTSLVVSGNGWFDAEQELRPFTSGGVVLCQGAGFVDKYGRGDYSSGITLSRCDINDLAAFRVGQNRLLDITTP